MNMTCLKNVPWIKTSVIGFGLMLLIILSGCARSRTLVVLLPDTDGKVGTIHLQTAKGDRRVDTANYAVQSESRRKTPEAPKRMESRKVQKLFKDALAAEPEQEYRFDSFTLYCYWNTVNLTPDSVKSLPSVINVLKKMQPREIYVVGHADRVGTEKYNYDLSRRRALAAKSLLISKGIKPNIIIASHLGETKPKIETRDEVEEPLNRRIEIITKTKK